MRENAAFVWRTLRHLGVRDADVDDVCQEVFVVVHRKLAEFEGRSGLRTWLYGICVRSAAAYRRRARVRLEVPLEGAPEEAAYTTPEAALDEHETLAMLERALATLDDEKREAFVLYEIEELPMSQVAEILECPLQTAYSRHRAAREKVLAFFRRSAIAPDQPKGKAGNEKEKEKGKEGGS